MIPIFKSHHSLLRSTLTLEPETKLDETKPVSIFAIAAAYKLKQVFLLESSYSGAIEFHKACAKNDVTGCFGIELCCCADLTIKDEASLSTEHRINIWATDNASLRALQKIYSIAWTDGFYYRGRIDLATLKKNWHSGLIISIPFYDSFLFNNMNYFGRNIVPEWGTLKPLFFLEDHQLPFDSMLGPAIETYTKYYGFETQRVHSCFYYKTADFLDYQVLRCISERTTITKPNLNFCCSDTFSFEAYLERVGPNAGTSKTI